MSTVTEATPAVTPVAVETARVYHVAGAPALPDPAGQLFEPELMRIWDRLHGAGCVVLYGPVTATGQPTARVFPGDAGAELPGWVKPYLLAERKAQGEASQLLEKIFEYASSDWLPFEQWEQLKVDIEREVLAMATAAEVATGQPGQPHILVRQIDRGADRKQALDVRISNVTHQDEAVALLMMVVQQLTRVSGESYLRLVDACREVAARERARDHAGLGLMCTWCGGPCQIDGPVQP